MADMELSGSVMTAGRRLWVLGAPDPEMQLIEQMLHAAGEQVATARDRRGRVTPGTAYNAHELSITADEVPALVSGLDALYLIECHWFVPREYVQPLRVVRIDHHRPGDPGYGKPPELYWEASSLGQTYEQLFELAKEPPGSVRSEWRFAAAADHCLMAAYHGQCPGVIPDRLMLWRVETRAAFQRVSVDVMMERIGVARAALRAASAVDLGGSQVVRDMRRHEPWPELPEAAAREGLSYIAGPLIEPDGRLKFTCGGTQAVVAAFLAGEGPAAHLNGRYGDPARGFAGGYLGGDAVQDTPVGVLPPP